MTHNHHGAERIVTAAQPRANADMNITPMIDVLLVLLVIFMAAIPLSQRGVDVTLPQTTAAPAARAAPPARIVVGYDADRAVSINNQPTTLDELESRLRDIFAERRDKTLYIMAAGSLTYGDVVAVIDAAKGAGVERVGIVTEAMRRTGA